MTEKERNYKTHQSREFVFSYHLPCWLCWFTSSRFLYNTKQIKSELFQILSNFIIL